MDADDRVLDAERLGGAPDLEAADVPGVEGDDVVDDERDLPVGAHVVELPRLGQVSAVDADHARFGLDVEPDRAVLQGPVGGGGSGGPEAPGGEVFAVG